jgi:hypothetical protein
MGRNERMKYISVIQLALSKCIDQQLEISADGVDVFATKRSLCAVNKFMD